MSEPYVGEIKMFGGNFAIRGWIPCDGRLLPIAEYESLFFLIGDNYGGDGVTTFAVPDLRSRIPIHMGTGTGLSNYEIGQRGGVESVTLTIGNLPVHSHSVAVSSQAATASSPSNTTYFATTTGSLLYSNTTTSSATLATDVIGVAGANQPFEISMPYLVINFMISPFGIFPSQT